MSPSLCDRPEVVQEIQGRLHGREQLLRRRRREREDRKAAEGETIICHCCLKRHVPLVEFIRSELATAFQKRANDFGRMESERVRMILIQIECKGKLQYTKEGQRPKF